MSQRHLLPVATAFAALLAMPVLAQTATSPTPTVPPGATPPHAATATMPAPAGTTTSAANAGASSTGASSTYLTSDQQIRASKLIGSSVYNDQHQNIGSIDDLLLDQNHDVSSVVLSVGGFLGVGSKLVQVPYQNLHVANNTIVMPGASQDSLKKMPTYDFHGAS